MAVSPVKDLKTLADGTKVVRWKVRVNLGNGKREGHIFKSKGEADTYCEEANGKKRTGTFIPSSEVPTVSEACELWLAAVAAGRGERGPAEAATLRNYRQHVNDYIVPALGTIRLNKLTKADATGFKTDLLTTVWRKPSKAVPNPQPLTRATARKVLTSFKGILSEMHDQGRVAQNVAAKVQIGSDRAAKQEKVVVPARADVTALLTTLDRLCTNHGQADAARSMKAWRKYRALFATAVHTGMRASELRGLSWPQVDLSGALIHVTQRADESGNIGPCKSTSGRRTIAIPSKLVQMLREWKMECPPSKAGLVFPTRSGKPQSLSNIFSRAWSPLQVAAGVVDWQDGENGDVQEHRVAEPRYNFHALRHYRASALIASGASALDVMKELGHSDIKVTFNTYGHLFTDDAANAVRAERAEQLAALVGA